MWPIYSVVPSTQTWPPPGQSICAELLGVRLAHAIGTGTLSADTRSRLRRAARCRRPRRDPISCRSGSACSAGSSLATNRIAGSLSEPLTCSHHAPPGTARVSNCSQSKRLPSTIAVAPALERRDQQARGLPQRLRLLARPQHLHEEGHGLEHRAAGQSDRHIRSSAPRRDRRPSP